MKPRPIAASGSIGCIALLLLLAITGTPAAGHPRGGLAAQPQATATVFARQTATA